ncbi:MAG: PAS domain S-box protein [Desulfobacteraceae bacterium]|nr:PAS domain S-box protein [Desulfobacteraceae bacterium]
MNETKIKFNTSLIVFLLSFVFVLCTGIFFLEKEDQKRDEFALHQLTQVIENAIWNFDNTGPVGFLKLAAKHQNYKQIIVYKSNIEVFIEIDGPKLSMIDQFLLKIGLIKIRKFESNIFHNSQNIGRVEVIHYHDTIYEHSYLFITLGLTFLVALFFVRISFAKRILKRQADELEVHRNQLEEVVKERTKALIEREKLLRSIFENAVVGMCLISTKGYLEMVNPALANILGFPLEKLLSKNISVFTHPDDIELSFKKFKLLLDGETQKIRFEKRYIHSSGSTVWALVGTYLVRDYEDVPQYFVTFIEDITDRKQAEDEKEYLWSRLQQAQKMEAIGTLAGGIAHDFNNILAAIIGYTEIARMGCHSEQRVTKSLDKVLHASNRAKGLVQQILAFSHQANTKRILLQPASIVKDTIKMLRASLPTTIEISQNIVSKTGLILANSTQIHQIVMNFGTNAFHAMEETSGRLDISLKETILSSEDLVHEPGVKAGTFVKLSICDSGPGIAPEIKDKIFDPYFTTKEIGKGTGLGLSIVHGIVKNYGGFISFYSELGEGATFHVFLPVIEKDLQPDETITVEQIPEGKERILFIDDEEILTEMGKNMLEKLGYQVTVRNSSFEALDTFQNQPDQFDLVITDQTMPGMTGSDIARKMIQIRPEIPIILCTGYSTIISEEKAKSMGIKEFALKPFFMRDIAVLIRKVLDKS